MLTGDILRRSAARFPERAAIVCGDSRMSYRELDAASDRFAAGLAARGLAKGDMAAIVSANSPAYAVVYFGCARAGVVLANISVRATAEDLRFMLDLVGARLLVVEDARAALAATALPKVDSVEQVVVIGDLDKADLDGAVAFDDFVASQPAEPPAVALDADDPLAITFTGGTTGEPKAVLHSHRARFVNNLSGAAYFGLREDDIVALVTPLFHCAGLFVWFQLAIYLGTRVVMLPAWDAEAFVDAVEAEGVTAVFLVPTQIGDLIHRPAFDAKRLKSLANINYAGSPMPLAVLREAIAKLPRVAFTEHLGQSETGPMAVRLPGDPADKLGSVGRPCDGLETRVVDAKGDPTAPGEIGEIVTRGDHLMTEYYRDPEQTAAAYRTGGGWLWTGDLGTVDEDGFIWLVDRSKDMIISGGENVYPAEIENALAAHAAVAECAVFGIPDERFGEVPAAHVVLKSGAAVTADELIDFCASRIARFKRPRLVEFVAEIPKTAIGKAQKNLLRAPYWEGRERKI